MSRSGRPDTAASAAGVHVLPSTEASGIKRRSVGAKPERRAAMTPCSVSGTSRVYMWPVGLSTGPACSNRSRSRTLRALPTATHATAPAPEAR